MEDPFIVLFAINLEGPFFVIGIFLMTVTWGFGFPRLVIDTFNSLDCKRMLMITAKIRKIILDCILLKTVQLELALARSHCGRLNVGSDHCLYLTFYAFPSCVIACHVE